MRVSIYSKMPWSRLRSRRHNVELIHWSPGPWPRVSSSRLYDHDVPEELERVAFA